ncbi:MAG: hypothetical protein C0469_14990 [Cyanobacteria bacterium DS2.3.42]|nr:hypothetical protein [Cyanobacteria bacterium DS2.3.42]
MGLEVAIYSIGALLSAVAAGFTFRRAARLKAAGDNVNYLDQSGAAVALSILALVLVIFATH